jgi:hypothetical protein
MSGVLGLLLSSVRSDDFEADPTSGRLQARQVV